MFDRFFNFYRLIAKESRYFAISLIVILILLAMLTIFMFIYSGTPNHFTLSAGSEGSLFQQDALSYQRILSKQGIQLTILDSKGSVENLENLSSPSQHADVGFVLSGELQNAKHQQGLVSLGSIGYQPLLVFYRGDVKDRLSEFKGMKLEIGVNGTGANLIAKVLLKLNHVEAGKAGTVILESDLKNPEQALLSGKVDVLFMMGDATRLSVIKQLLDTENIRLFNFDQADAYTRKVSYLHKMILPKGVIDFAKNIPEHDVELIGPTIELVAQSSFHPALSDALLDAAKHTHGKPGLFKKRGEFPTLMEHDFPASEDAIRFYSSGKKLLYRTFPFWLASLINRILSIILPVVLLVLPIIKLLPAIYRWRIQSRIFPLYNHLLNIEQVIFEQKLSQKTLQAELEKLEALERRIWATRVPARYGDIFYGLKGHVQFVKDRILQLLDHIKDTAEHDPELDG